MYRCTDQMGRSVVLTEFPPRRIVSLVPSQTELLAELGLGAAVVGITKFCVRPAEWFQQKKRVGGTKTVDPHKVLALAPDLILGNKEENDREQIRMLAAQAPVWMSDVYTLADACDMIRQVGALTGRPEGGDALAGEVERRFSAGRPAADARRARVAYLTWRKPYMVAAGRTFVDAMLTEAGFDNVFAHLERYPEVTRESLNAAQPEILLLASEPFPFSEKHQAELRVICPKAQIMLVDGELFSWYGSRLLHAPAYFRQLRETAAGGVG